MRGAAVIAGLASAAALPACMGSMESYFAQDVVDIVTDQTYVAGSHNPAQQLDLFLPRGVEQFPVVVFIHGGFWIHQDKDYFEPVVGLYHNVGIALARKGIGTAVINYRLVPEVTFDGQFDDVAQAIRWVHDHIAEHHGDPTAMVIAGHSAGGHIAALAAFDDPRLTAAGVDVSAIRGYAPLSPILDLQQMADSSTEHAQIAAEVFGTALAAYSPTTYFKAAAQPVLILMGEHDESFLLAQIPPAITALQALGAPITFDQLAGKTHDSMVLDIDGDHDTISPLLATFVHDVTH
jgi:acetyl esterase/lipase